MSIINVNKFRYVVIILICLFYLEVGFIVALTSVLIPQVIRNFNLPFGIAAKLPFAYYLSFAVISLKFQNRRKTILQFKPV